MRDLVRSSSALLVVLAACAPREAPPAPLPPAPAPPAPVASAPPAPSRHDALERGTFNQLAVRANLPVFWEADRNGNRAIDPNEVRALWFYPSAGAWVRDGAFTPEFELAYSALLASAHPTPQTVSPDEAARRALVLEDLDQGRPTLLHADLRGLQPGEKQAVREILAAASLIDRLYAIQTGAAAVADRVPEDHPPSRSLFRRNWGPKCAGPRTEKNPACAAFLGATKPKVDVYPSKLQEDPKFCAELEKRKDAKTLLAPFVVVREKDGALSPVKYTEAYGAHMNAVAVHLERAAASLGPDEKPFSTYLVAAAKAFRDNDWEAADEAWSKMNGQNSRYYLRIGPDEVYWEPCSQKAGFHVSFARINPEALKWQQALNPLQQEMEAGVAKLIGMPYRERKVTFHLPDFIDVVANAGDSRNAFGATIGQSLPNWGKVANESRGRTVAMSNLYLDPDSRTTYRAQALSLLDAEAAKLLSDDSKPGLLSTILHEATHNLGPSHEYKFAGKTDSLAFGGGLASMLEELKSQTGALYLLELLTKKGVITPELQRQSYLDSIVWAFGHIAQGMYTEGGQRKAYSQLAAIQIGFLMDEGAIRFDPAGPAANGKDTGAFKIDFAKLPAASEKLMKVVARIKAVNDKAGAEALAAKYVEGDKLPQTLISERVLRNPKASFVYSVDL